MVTGQLVPIFLAGIAGSYHCIGMCGGIACGLAPDPNSKVRTIVRQCFYNSGRVATYVFLGAVAGSLGFSVAASGSAWTVLALQKSLAVIAGFLMFAMALKFLRPPRRNESAQNQGEKVITLVQAPLNTLLKSPGGSAPIALGVLNGFLPCPLVYAFLALAATATEPLAGMTIMGVFGLGTFPAMLAVGWFGNRLRLSRKRKMMKAAGWLILAFGILTIARAFLSPAGQHLHSAGS